MPRNDGRIEPGQKLAGAISARAWNRAQDAADRVLGVGTGFGAGGFSELQYAIVVPIRLTSAPLQNYQHIGVPVVVQSGVMLGGGDGGPHSISLLNGIIAEPTDLTNTTLLPVPGMFALTVEPMVSGQNATSVVRCAIKGLAIARVRRFATSDRYVTLPTRRSSGETVESLRGTLETSAAGYGRILFDINSDFSLVSI